MFFHGSNMGSIAVEHGWAEGPTRSCRRPSRMRCWDLRRQVEEISPQETKMIWWCLIVWYCLILFDIVWYCLILFDTVWYCLILRMIDSVSLVLLIIELFQEDCSQTHHSCIFWNIPGSIRVPHSRCLRCSQLWSCHSSPTAQPCGSVKTKKIFHDFPLIGRWRSMYIHLPAIGSLFSCSPRYQYVPMDTNGYLWVPSWSQDWLWITGRPTMDVGTGDWGPLGTTGTARGTGDDWSNGSIGWSIGYTPWVPMSISPLESVEIMFWHMNTMNISF